jgi:hypothetical protein
MEQVIHFKYVHIREHGTAPQFPVGDDVSTIIRCVAAQYFMGLPKIENASSPRRSKGAQ